jgi:nucleoside-diphosphate-sugar epimerase
LTRPDLKIKNMHVLITGGSGLIGTHLSKKLKEKGYETAVLSRKKHSDPDTKTYLWDPGKNEIEKEQLRRPVISSILRVQIFQIIDGPERENRK